MKLCIFAVLSICLNGIQADLKTKPNQGTYLIPVRKNPRKILDFGGKTGQITKETFAREGVKYLKNILERTVKSKGTADSRRAVLELRTALSGVRMIQKMSRIWNPNGTNEEPCNQQMNLLTQLGQQSVRKAKRYFRKIQARDNELEECNKHPNSCAVLQSLAETWEEPFETVDKIYGEFINDFMTHCYEENNIYGLSCDEMAFSNAFMSDTTELLIDNIAHLKSYCEYGPVFGLNCEDMGFMIEMLESNEDHEEDDMYEMLLYIFMEGKKVIEDMCEEGGEIYEVDCEDIEMAFMIVEELIEEEKGPLEAAKMLSPFLPDCTEDEMFGLKCPEYNYFRGIMKDAYDDLGDKEDPFMMVHYLINKVPECNDFSKFFELSCNEIDVIKVTFEEMANEDPEEAFTKVKNHIMNTCTENLFGLECPHVDSIVNSMEPMFKEEDFNKGIEGMLSKTKEAISTECDAKGDIRGLSCNDIKTLVEPMFSELNSEMDPEGMMKSMIKNIPECQGESMFEMNCKDFNRIRAFSQLSFENLSFEEIILTMKEEMPKCEDGEMVFGMRCKEMNVMKDMMKEMKEINGDMQNKMMDMFSRVADTCEDSLFGVSCQDIDMMNMAMESQSMMGDIINEVMEEPKSMENNCESMLKNTLADDIDLAGVMSLLGNATSNVMENLGSMMNNNSETTSAPENGSMRNTIDFATLVLALLLLFK